MRKRAYIPLLRTSKIIHNDGHIAVVLAAPPGFQVMLIEARRGNSTNRRTLAGADGLASSLIMTTPFDIPGALTLLVLTSVSPVQREQNKLAGLWECYKQHDTAELSSCLYSIEFFPDGRVFQKQFSDAGIELPCTYSVKGKRINVRDSKTGKSWHFDFKFLANGDLFLYKPPWHWRGWLTKDSTKVPKDHGCGTRTSPVP